MNTCDKLAQKEGGGGHSSEDPLSPFRGDRHAVVIPPWRPDGLPKRQLDHKQHCRPLCNHITVACSMISMTEHCSALPGLASIAEQVPVGSYMPEVECRACTAFANMLQALNRQQLVTQHTTANLIVQLMGRAASQTCTRLGTQQDLHKDCLKGRGREGIKGHRDQHVS